MSQALKTMATRHVLELTDPLALNFVANQGISSQSKNTGTPTRTDTPPVDDEEHTLSAMGDISLSSIDFVPGPPSALTPVRKLRRDNKRPLGLKTDVADRYPLVIKKVLPPGPSKASVRKAEASFEMMVLNLKKSREEGKSKPDVATSGIPASEIDVHAPQPRRLIDMKNFGIDTVKAQVDSHDVVENSARTKATGGRRSPGTTTDENRDSAIPAVVTTKPKKGALRGNARLPKRPPIPRWDVDNNLGTTGSDGGYHLGLTSSPFQTT